MKIPWDTRSYFPYIYLYERGTWSCEAVAHLPPLPLA